MKKKLISAFFLLTMLVTSAFAVDLYVDGSQLTPDVPPTIVSGRTLVPLRSIFEALNADVQWDQATRTATATKADTTVQVTLNQKTAYVNGAANTLDVPAQIIQNRTMVPARFIAESLNARVLWDNNVKTVYVISAEHKPLVVEYLDVGQADSILLSSDGEYMLIDAGNNADGDDVVSYLRSVGADELKYAVGTHPHEDHIGGMDDVINDLTVDRVLLPNTTTNTQTYGDVLTAIESKNVPVTVPQASDTYQLGDATIAVVAAEQADELNNTSIVLKATYKNTSFLFMGDAEYSVEATLLGSADLNSDVIKIGHHGSSTSTGAAFLAAVSPKAAVISVGADNSYDHPAQETLDKLAGIPVWRTDKNGTVIAMTGGSACKLTSLGTNQSPEVPSKSNTSKPSTPSTATPTTPSTPSTSKPSTPATPSTPSTTKPSTSSGSSSGSSASSGNSGSSSNYTGTVYITPTGKRYHYLSSCAGKNATPTTLSNAKSRGLTPCNKCAK